MRRKRKKAERPSHALAGRVWDSSLQVGDLVFLDTDGTLLHVYEVRECHYRVLMDHELFNNPSLLARGFKPGDELPPLLVIRRVRNAPLFSETPIRHTIERTVDADKVSKITVREVETLISNLTSIASQLEAKDGKHEDDSLREG